MNNPTRSPSTLAFFVLTYCLSWLIWIPLALSHLGVGPFRVEDGLSQMIRLFGVLMPAVAAILLTAAYGGRSAVRRLLSRLGIWRVHWGWWLAAAGVYPALLLSAALIYHLGGWPPPLEAVQAAPAALLINIVFLAVATLGEEIGWRGVALPSLQRQSSPLRASLILGLAWATWHLPFWLLMDTFDQYGIFYFALNYLFIMPSTAYLTWIFNHTRASLLLPVAFHLSFNLVNVAILPVTVTAGAYALFIGLQLPLVIVLAARLARREQTPVQI